MNTYLHKLTPAKSVRARDFEESHRPQTSVSLLAECSVLVLSALEQTYPGDLVGPPSRDAIAGFTMEYDICCTFIDQSQCTN